MNISQLTVNQVADILMQDDVSSQFIETCKNDSRISVIRLLEKWQNRQQAQETEKLRVQQLYKNEYRLKAQGYERIAGMDEAGRGPLAGPVVVAAVILPLGCHLPKLNDSKKLSEKQRIELYNVIKNAALAVEYTVISAEEIDSINIYQATVKGMYETIRQLSPQPQAVLVDAVPLPELSLPCEPIIGGDAVSASIAAASIIAKTERDRIMEELDLQYGGYGFAKHKGYGTSEHLSAIQKYGPCPIHRKSFEPIKSWGE